MGMSTHIIGLVSKDNDLYQKHAKVLIACIEAGVQKLPEETAKFFNEEYAEKYLLDDILKIEVPYTINKSDFTKMIYEIKVSEIDPKTDIIRFINSW
jgi:hypothetical protein